MNTSSAPLLGQVPKQLASVLISAVLVQKLTDQQNSMESPETDPQIMKLTTYHGDITDQWGKDGLFNNWGGTNQPLKRENENEISDTLYQQK